MFRLSVLPLVLVLGLGSAGQVFCQRECTVARPAPTAVASACHGGHGAVLHPQDGARCPRAYLSGAVVTTTTRDGGASSEQRMLVVVTVFAPPPGGGPTVLRTASIPAPRQRQPVETPLRI